MDKCVEAERKLGELLGYTDITPTSFNPHYMVGWLNDERGPLPQWCRADGPAFVLMVEHDLQVDLSDPSGVLVCWPHYEQGIFCPYGEHTDKATAVRYAIVQSVIGKLAIQRSNEASQTSSG
jgi:hypothetical protein